MITRPVIVAIDPDVDASGIAIFDKIGKSIGFAKWPLPKLVEYMRGNADKLHLIVEGGWLNKKSTFHFAPNERVACKIASKTGRNEQVGKTIVAFADFYKVSYKIVKPLKRNVDLFKRIYETSPKTGKITHNGINKLLMSFNLVPLKRTNQDERDAILLLFQNI